LGSSPDAALIVVRRALQVVTPDGVINLDHPLGGDDCLSAVHHDRRDIGDFHRKAEHMLEVHSNQADSDQAAERQLISGMA